MSYKHPDVLNLIDDKLDQKIRNVKIKTAWEVMKRWTQVGYVKRVESLMEQFDLGPLVD